jgi:hypothetical protein
MKKYLKPLLLLGVLIGLFFYLYKKNKKQEIIVTQTADLPQPNNQIMDWFNNYFNFETTTTQKKLAAL